MGTPTKKRTSGQRKRRASHFALKPRNLMQCPKCKKAILPHRACGFCGYYKGRQVVNMQRTRTKSKKSDSA